MTKGTVPFVMKKTDMTKGTVPFVMLFVIVSRQRMGRFGWVSAGD